MKKLQAFKYQLRPNGGQQMSMRFFSGACRFVYNRALAEQERRFKSGEKRLGYAGLCRLITDWRKNPDMVWLKGAPTHPLQQAMKDLGRAYSGFLSGRSGVPRFKKKGRRESFRYPDPKQIRLDQGNSRIFLPKLGWLRYRNSREVVGSVKNVTVSLSGGKWFISIQTEREVPNPAPEANTAVGIDLGVARFATLSDGSYIEPLNEFKRHHRALRKAQQSMSRKVKFSNNWKKERARVQKLHARIGNSRRDYLHKCSTMISKNHAMVVIEDLKVKNMTKSAKGAVNRPGKNLRAKSSLNRSILDQGWSEFRRQLGYKLAWRGGWLEAVPPHNTSRTCPSCGYVSADNRETQARFACLSCGFEGHADHIAATNILRAGHARCACEVSDARMSPAAGTRRSDSGEDSPSSLSAVGIPHRKEGEDANDRIIHNTHDHA
jgi:putative transposase